MCRNEDDDDPSTFEAELALLEEMETEMKCDSQEVLVGRKLIFVRSLYLCSLRYMNKSNQR